MRLQTLLVFWLPALVENPAQQKPGERLSEWLNWDAAVEAESVIAPAPFDECGPALLQCSIHLHCHRPSPVAQQAQYVARHVHGDNQPEPDLCLYQLVVLVPGVVVDYCCADCCRLGLFVVAGQNQSAVVGHGDGLLPGWRHHTVPVGQEYAQQGTAESEPGHQVLSAFCAGTLESEDQELVYRELSFVIQSKDTGRTYLFHHSRVSRTQGSSEFSSNMATILS